MTLPLNVVLFSVGSRGDVSPFIEIGRRLKARGHTVNLITHFGYEEIAKRAGLEFVAVDSPREYQEFIADQHLLNDPRGVPEFIRRHSLSKIAEHSELIAQSCKRRNTVLVTRDLFDTAIRLTAERSRLPLTLDFRISQSSDNLETPTTTVRRSVTTRHQSSAGSAGPAEGRGRRCAA